MRSGRFPSCLADADHPFFREKPPEHQHILDQTVQQHHRQIDPDQGDIQPQPKKAAGTLIHQTPTKS